MHCEPEVLLAVLTQMVAWNCSKPRVLNTSSTYIFLLFFIENIFGLHYIKMLDFKISC